MKLHYSEKKEHRSIPLVFMVLLSVVLYVGNIFAFNTSDIANVICILIFPFMSVSGLLTVVAFLIPLNSGITVLYIYGYAIALLLLKKGTVNLRVLIPTLLIALWEIVMSFFLPKVDFMSFAIYICTVFLLFYLMNTEDADYKQCCYAYIAGTMVLLLVIMTTAIQNTSWEKVLSGQVRIGTYEGQETLEGAVAVLSENANSLAYYALTAILLAFSLIKSEKSFGRLLLIVSILFGTLVGIFTVSRTFLIVLLMGVFLVFTTRYNFKQKIILAMVGCVILWVGLPYLLENTQIFDAFENRFEESSVEEGNGRIDLFWQYMDFLWNNPARLVFGTGAIGYKDICKCSNSLHNGTQQILVSYGLIGFFPMLYALLSPIFGYFKKNRFRLEKIVPLLVVVVFTQTIQFLNPFNLMLPYAIAVMYMKIPEKEQKV